MNINSAIIKGAKILKNNLIDNAFLDSEILMAKVINKSREYILLNLNKPLSTDDQNLFEELIKKRSNRKPIAYLTNKKFFWDYEFYVNKHTLIPRPDTELIVDNVLKLTRQKNNCSILDIGVGSGCILLTILNEKKNFYGTGIDISNKCINISKKNAINFNVNSRLRLFKTNVDKFKLGKYDLIVSNPPYIERCKLKYLEKDVVSFEPKFALDGGLDGLSEIRND